MGIGISAAATAIVARRTGEKKPEEAATAGGQTVLVSVFLSIPIMIVGIFFSHELFELMGADEGTTKAGVPYAQIALGTNVIIMLLFVFNAIFRSSGDASVAMRVLLVANGLNIILDPLLIFGLGPIPAMGVQGASLATAIGRGSAVVFQIYLLFFAGKRITLTLKNFIPDFQVLKKVVQLAQGAVFQYLISTSSWIFLVRIITSFGSIAVAGYTIGIRILMFILLPAWGLSAAAATLTGQNIGAGKPDRAIKSVRISSYLIMSYMLVNMIIIIIFAKDIASLFSTDPEVIRHSVNCLTIMSWGFIFYGAGMAAAQSLNGAGDTKSPMLINIVAFWIIEIPLAYYLSFHTSIADNGSYYAIIFSELVMSGLAVWIFSRGKWKTKVV